MDSKHFLIVSGSSGIGLELVKLLLEEGHQITVVSRTSENLPAHKNVRHIKLDVIADEISKDLIPDSLYYENKFLIE